MDDRQHAVETGTNFRGSLEDVKLIATGGMSLIFRAKQPTLDRFIVVKKLKDELLGNPEMMERFRREARALASVLHQNIAHVYDFVENGRESFILMEYIDGLDVSTVVEKLGHLPPLIAAAITLGVAKGVGYIHAHNLIHRDIKPANIRLTTRGEVKLMDFGIVMDIENHSLTRPGTMVGSPSYLSPEQVLGDTLTHSADIFLVGICLYEMLTGSRPFKEEGDQSIFQAIREAKYTPARQMQTGVPKEVDRIVKKCLHRKPERRYASMKELVSALEHYLGPTINSHLEDLILKYLDDEALLSAKVPYNEIREAKNKFWTSIPFHVWVLMTALVVASFFLGSRFGGNRPFTLEVNLPKALSPTHWFNRTPATPTPLLPSKSHRSGK